MTNNKKPASFLESQQITVLDSVPEERTITDKDKLMQEFLGFDLTDDEIKELAQGSLKITYNPDTGEPQKLRVEDPEAGQNMRHRLTAYLLGFGYTKQQISKATGYSMNTLNQVLRLPWVREAAKKFQDKLIEKIEQDKQLALARLGEHSLEAADVLADAMYSEDENIQVRAARSILEGIGVYDSKRSAAEKVDIGIQIANIIKETGQSKIIKKND